VSITTKQKVKQYPFLCFKANKISPLVYKYKVVLSYFFIKLHTQAGISVFMMRSQKKSKL